MLSYRQLAGLVVGQAASAEQLALFSAEAAKVDRRLVVGALVVDERGRVFAQRRSLSRALFPGKWDLVGGHVETGEGLVTALAREVLEETGWSLTAVGPVVEIVDWEAAGVGRREVDFLVAVDGDLGSPALEDEKHDAWSWVDSEGVAALQDPTGGDDWVHRVVSRALAVAPGWSR